MMEYKFHYLLSSLAWDFTMLIAMLLPVIVIVGIVYLGLNLWERRTKETSTNCKPIRCNAQRDK